MLTQNSAAGGLCMFRVRNRFGGLLNERRLPNSRAQVRAYWGRN
jgi:hypothetical protein